MTFLWVKSPFLFSKVMLKSRIIKEYGLCTGVPSTPPIRTGRIRTGSVYWHIAVHVCSGKIGFYELQFTSRDL